MHQEKCFLTPRRTEIRVPLTSFASMQSRWNSQILPTALIAFSVASTLSSSRAPSALITAFSFASASCATPRNRAPQNCAHTPSPKTAACRVSACGSVAL